MKSTIVTCLFLVVATENAVAEPALSWKMEAKVGSSQIEDGGEKAESFAEAAFGVSAPVANGEVFAGVSKFLPLEGNGDVFDEETEYTVGFASSLGSAAWEVSAAWIDVAAEGEDDEVEFGAALELDGPLYPVLEGKYNQTTNELGLQVSAGPEWHVGSWTITARTTLGILGNSDGEDITYAGLESSAYYAFAESVSAGPFVIFGTSDSYRFVREFSEDAETQFDDNGFAIGVHLVVER